jgi:hypothetical protein
MSAASGSQPLSEEKKHEFKPVEEVEGMDSSEEWKLNPEDIVNRCHVCQATENLMRCSACKAVYYCSKQHQVSVIIDYEVRGRETAATTENKIHIYKEYGKKKMYLFSRNRCYVQLLIVCSGKIGQHISPYANSFR